MPDRELEAAELCSAALLVAAVQVIRCIDDLQVTGSGDDGLPETGLAEDSFVYEWFPKRYRGASNEDFFRKVMVRAVQVAADLADPEDGPASHRRLDRPACRRRDRGRAVRGGCGS